MDCIYWEHKSNNKTVAKELLDPVTADIVVSKTKMNVVSTRQRKKNESKVVKRLLVTPVLDRTPAY